MGQKSIILAVGLIIFAVILAIIFVVGRLRPDSPSGAPSDVTPEEASRNVIPVIDIINQPMVFDEYAVEVDSEISYWVTNRAFVFEVRTGGGLGGGQRRSLLAIAPRPFQLPQSPNDNEVGLGEKARVTAKGKIEILSEEDLEATLEVDFDDPGNALYSDVLKKWKLGPVLMLSDLQIDSSPR